MEADVGPVRSAIEAKLNAGGVKGIDIRVCEFLALTTSFQRLITYTSTAIANLAS